MGNFYVNFTTRGVTREVIVKYLAVAKRTAYVGPTVAGTTVFFDEKSDCQDDAEIKAFGKRTSKNIGAPVLAVLNHDDDLLCYWLFKDGKVIDQYNSCPAYFDDDEEERPSGGDAKVLCKAFGVVAKATQVEKVLRREEYVFAFERHKELAKLLKHPWQYVSMGYDHINVGMLSKDVTKMSKAMVIKESLRQAAIEFGFSGNGEAFHKILTEVVWTIALVKERGTRYGIASGVWIRHLPGNVELLEEYGQNENTIDYSNCHVLIDIDDLSKTRGKYALKTMLDSKTKLDNDTIRERIKYEIERFLMPAFEKLSTAADCCKNVKTLSYVGDGCWNMRDYCASLKKGTDTRVKPVVKARPKSSKKKIRR